MAREVAAIPLHYLFAHSAWATDELLSFCEPLPAERLVATVPGAFGTVFETLHHLIESDGHYVGRVAPQHWLSDLRPDANDAWEASLGGPDAFEWVRHGGPETSRVERRRTAFLTGDLPGAFALLRARATEVARLWSLYAEGDPDPSALCAYSGGVSPAGIQIVQALHHGHAHREQVCTILTTLHLEPPNLQGLAWASATGSMRDPG